MTDGDFINSNVLDMLEFDLLEFAFQITFFTKKRFSLLDFTGIQLWKWL